MNVKLWGAGILAAAACCIMLAVLAADQGTKAPSEWIELQAEVKARVHQREPDSALPARAAAAAPAAASSKVQPQQKPQLQPPDTDKAIDINRATEAELMTLSGIGKAKAQAIIADREQNGFFRSVEDLQRVKGIGAKMLEKLKPSIVAAP
ncbi:ComEA family DNA-binding protein [Paenibacillus sp. GCM10027626]|uniref:ComEA family DNA-binding protein n=1 Tax=Paenibacillus sp. GCM10027626 TaxID=3273411 RepID=UPI00362832C5